MIQKWIDQSISANHYYQYSSDGISIGGVIKDILYAYKYGLKTLYYANTDDKEFLKYVKNKKNISEEECR